MQKEINISPIRMIRIAKDLTMEEMAQFFLVTRAYISAIEKNKREFRLRTLKFGLNNLNISLNDYFILEEFSQELLNSELCNRDKYKFMLIKTLCILEPDEKNSSEEILEKYGYGCMSKTKNRISFSKGYTIDGFEGFTSSTRSSGASNNLIWTGSYTSEAARSEVRASSTYILSEVVKFDAPARSSVGAKVSNF